MLKTSLLFVVLLFGSLFSFAHAGEGHGPTGDKHAAQQPTVSTPGHISLAPANSASAQLTPVEHTAPALATTTEPVVQPTERPASQSANNLRIGERAGGLIAGVKDWFQSRRILNKREAIVRDASTTLAGMVRLGIILMVVGLAVMILAIIIEGAIGNLFYTLGAILLVVGLVLFILGLVGVI